MNLPFSGFFLSASLLLAGSAFGAGAQKSPFTRLTDGPPTLEKTALAPSSYAPQVAKKLARPRLLYLNYELLTQMLLEEGVKIPAGGITDKMKKEFLDHVAYLVPSQFEKPGDFINEAKTFYADRYGGLGMNGNHGSGRAMSAGRIQVKGGGPTSLIGAHVDDGHRNGAINAVEALHETSWGEVLTHELPYGANRTLAIIDTGTDIVSPEGYTFPRAIAVREDPLRPAHFMRNPDATNEIPAAENKRMASVFKRLAESLPQKPGAQFSSEGKKLRAGISTFIERVAEQYAASWAKGYYHGATSPSNILMDGGMIDFGTQTSMSGYQRVQQILEDGELPSGDTMAQKTELFHNILDNFRENAPPELQQFVPTKEWADAYYDKVYREAMDRQMLRLTGIPVEFVDELAAKSEGRKLARLIEELAKKGNEKPVLGEKPVGDPGKYHIGRLLQDAAGSPGYGAAELDNALADEIPERKVRREFAEAYARLYAQVGKRAQKSGVSPDALRTYMKEAVSIRNKKNPDLVMYHEHSQKYYDQLWKLIDKSRKSDDSNLIQDFIDQRVQGNRRTFFDAKPFEVVVSEEVDPRSQVRTRKVFDAKANEYRTVKEANLPGLKMPAAEVGGPALRGGCPEAYGRF